MARIFEQEQAQQFGNPVSVVCSLPPAAQALPGFAAFAGGPRVTVEATPCSVPDAVTGAARPAMLLVCRASLLSAGAAAHPPPHPNSPAPPPTSVGVAAPFPAGAVSAAAVAAAAAAAAVGHYDADTGALTPAAQRQRDSMVAAHLPAIITVFTTDGRVLHQNPASEVYMGGIIPPTARPYTPQLQPPAAPPQVHPFSMPPLKDAGAGAGAQALTWSPGLYHNRAMAAASLGVEPTAQAAAAGDAASPRGAATTGGRSGNRPLSKAVAAAKAAALAGGGLPRAASSSALGFASRQQQLLQQQPQQIKSMDWAAAPVATRALASASAAAAGGSDTTGAAAGAAGVAASGGRGGGGGEEVWFGHGVLGLLFKYEPAKLQQLLEVLLGRGSVWQGAEGRAEAGRRRDGWGGGDGRGARAGPHRGLPGTCRSATCLQP